MVSPYSKDGKTLVADTYRISKERFVYNVPKGKVVRTVEEIWSTSLFFETSEGPQSPPLRGVGYIPRNDKKPDRDKNECPEDPKTPEIYLPTLLDKNEIVYLTSLGRGNNSGDDWNIETRGLTLTGLGAIAKFHYKNFNPPYGTDLAEYEHHFTLGRDEYIKVARIGVISVTGQRALHIKIGQRKIKNGHSYMEFKEYVEIIQKEITYFDKSLFKLGELNYREPENYIHARKYPPIYYSKNAPEPFVTNKPPIDGIIHSIDLPLDEKDNTFRDSYIWNIKDYLPNHPYTRGIEGKNWHTKYNRWPFKKVNSITFTTPPINSKDEDAQSYNSPK